MKEKERTRSNVLILEPDRDTGELFARALETHRGCKCYLAAGEADALALLKDIRFHLCVADLGLLMSGDYSLLRKIKKSHPEVVVLAGGYLHQKAHIALALAHGADGSFLKPIQVNRFRREVDALCFPERSAGL
ncbi:MAG: response regulator [Deltaproteobacteria bacterium]|nr:response regulator [Deltaproteobacteria bacterium]